jgi:uncharacterized protein (DUF58 family)
MTSRLRINSIVLPITTLVLITAQIIGPSPVWKGLLAALGGCWLVSYLWARSLQKNLHLERAMRFGWVQVGDKLEEQFILHNDGWFPATWVEISDLSTLPGYSIARATGVEGRSQNIWHTTGQCSRRGVYKLGHTTLRCGDPLGIYQVNIVQPESVTLMVMPPVIALPYIKITPGGRSGDGRPRPNAPEQTLTAAAVRLYAPGDSMRLIHWRTTARLNELYVRLLEGAPAGDWWIVLDFDRQVQIHYNESETTEELGVILAASIADRGLRSNRSVGILASGKEPIWMRPESGEQRRWEILRSLALLDPGETSLECLMESAAPSLGRKASLILITPSMKSDWLKPLTNLIWRGFNPIVILIDPSSFGSIASTHAMDNLLIDMNIPHHIMTRDLFKQPDAHPGPRGQWEWRIMPTGKAVPVRLPGDLNWKSLK